MLLPRKLLRIERGKGMHVDVYSISIGSVAQGKEKKKMN
jgi:hypothetical protein